MLTFITILHLFIALILIVFVLLQDSKGGAAGVFGGGSGANTLFGSTGGADFLTKMTRYTAIAFAATCLTLAYLTSKPQKSLMDNYVPPPAPVTPTTESQTPAPPNESGASTDHSNGEKSMTQPKAETNTKK